MLSLKPVYRVITVHSVNLAMPLDLNFDNKDK